MIDSRRRRWFPRELLILISLAFITTSTHAQTKSIPAASPEQLQAKASLFEIDGKWNDALEIWCKLYGQDRQNAEANKHIQICLRRIFQAQRQSDKSLREQVLSLSHSQAIALYGEVLTTVHAAYVDRSRVSPGRLFQQGVDEFLLSLNDPNFRKQHMPAALDKEIADFQARVREYVSVRSPETIAEAIALMKLIASTAKRELQIAKTSVVVLEFIGGACNSLDEYSSYLSPEELIAEAQMQSESSVVDVHFAKDGIGYLRISHFQDTTPDEVDAAIATLKTAPQGMNLGALILDLRGNTGGLFSSAVQVVERFVPQGVIVSTQGQLDEFNKVHNAVGKMNLIELPLIVLVDGDTASAAEVLAGAFRDHQRATLVGTPTYGKGSIQSVLQFQTAEETDEHGKAKPRTGGIRITLARFFTPNGQAISGVGVSPHVVEPDKARQLETAVDQASRYVSAPMP